MYIQKINIKNFRLLKDVELSLEKRTTVIVGRNNSGKTSLTELFRRLLSDKFPVFYLEDFSLSVHEEFWTAFLLKYEGREESEIREVLPVMEVRLTMNYDENAKSLGLLGDFIIDLNPDCTEVIITIRYQLKDGKINELFDGIYFDGASSVGPQKASFFRIIKGRIHDLYAHSLLAVDPCDSTNQRHMDKEWSKLQILLQGGFINAQRGLDDTTHREKDVLGKILGDLFSTAKSELAEPQERDIAQSLEAAVREIQEKIHDNFNEKLTSLLPAFSLFGYPGLSDPGLSTETTLDTQRLLTNNTKVRYLGVNGVSLPETYNGLGSRNLIFILLQILEFFKSFKAKQPAPGIHLVFIEEPEAHLHPQMAEVFIDKLGEIAEVFAKRYNAGRPWPVQFIVTTHSTHMANEASFETIRYFLATSENQADGLGVTKIKDLRKGLGSEPEEDRKFLHQYLTLTHCDLFFADKAILIEGTTERLMLPKMIEKLDVNQLDSFKLSSQYISIVEISGAYAHRFFKLLEFLELRTLIITDLDSARENANGRLEACKVHESLKTTNGCIKNWFSDANLSPKDLIQKTDMDKICGIRFLAYQVPEENNGPCGRSFEGAFMLANPTLFDLNGTSIEEKESDAWSKAEKVKKSEFALHYAINQTNWVVPRYIAEGLHWLAKTSNESTTNPKLSEAESVSKVKAA